MEAQKISPAKFMVQSKDHSTSQGCILNIQGPGKIDRVGKKLFFIHLEEGGGEEGYETRIHGFLDMSIHIYSSSGNEMEFYLLRHLYPIKGKR